MHKPDLVWQTIQALNSTTCSAINELSFEHEHSFVSLERAASELRIGYGLKGPEELFEVISQALLSSVDRDCISGWGGIVHVV